MIKLKSWEEMTISERKDQTLRDLAKRKLKKEKIKKRAEYEANSFTIESSMRCIARVRESKNRGCRSCR